MDQKAGTSNIARRRRQAKSSGEEDYTARRAQLIEAAGRIFREKGYEKASISDFAKALGMDRASVYYYTSGKEELFRDIVQDAVRSNIELVEDIARSDASPREKIERVLIGLMVSFERHYPYLYAYIQEDMTRIGGNKTAWAREMQKLTERFDAATLSIVQEGIRAKAIRDDAASAQVISFAMIGMCNWTHRWFRPSGKLSGEGLGQAFADILLKGILTDDPESSQPV